MAGRRRVRRGGVRGDAARGLGTAWRIKLNTQTKLVPCRWKVQLQRQKKKKIATPPQLN